MLQCALTPIRSHWRSLHIAGPAKSPLIYKPHPASVPGTLPAVAGRSFKTIAQAVWNGSCVTDRNYWQFPQDTLRRELVSCSRARIVFGNRQIPASLKDNIVLNCSTDIIVLINLIDIITIFRIVICFQR